MKKNVKYIGSAVAVALLAAGAPVIVPMLEPTEDAYAWTSPIKNDNATPTQMLTAFKSQFDNRYIADPDTLVQALKTLSGDSYKNFLYFNKDDPKHIHDIQNDAALAKLKDQSKLLPGNYFEDSASDYYYRDILGYISITGAGSTTPENTASSEDLSTLADNISSGKVALPITVTIHLVQSTNSNDGNYDPPSLQGVDPSLTTFSFTISSSRMDIKQDQSVPTVFMGSTMTDSALTSGNNSLLITDNYSSSTDNSSDMSRTPIYGKSLFNSKQSALTYAKSSSFDPSSGDSGDATDALDSSGKLAKAGTYYQTISYNLDNGKDKTIDNMIAGTESAFPTYINGSKVSANDGTDYVLNKTAKTLTVARPITVSGTATAKLNSNLVVNLNSETNDTSLTDSTNDILVNDLGNPISVNKVELGDTYYNDDKTTKPADSVVDGKFTKTGTYYRRVTFYLTSIEGIDFEGNLSKDTTNNTVTYVQAVNVNNTVTKNVLSPNTTVGSSNSSTDVTGENTDKTANENTLTNPNGSLVDTTKGDYSGISFGTNYYKYDSDFYNSNATYSNVLNSEVLNNTGTPTSGVVDTNGNFAKSGDYLRTITFNLIDEVVDTNSFGTDDTTYKLSTDDVGNNTVTYVQKVHIAPAPKTQVSVDLDTISVGPGAINNTDKAKLTGTDNDTLTDTDSTISSLIDTTKGTNGISFGDKYYTDDELTTESTNGLNSVGTYYRTVTFYLNQDSSTLDFDKNVVASDDNSVTFVQTIVVNKVDVEATVPNISYQVGMDNPIGPNYDLKVGSEYLINARVSSGSNYYNGEANAKNKTNPISYKKISDIKTPGDYYRELTFELGDKYDGLEVSNYNFQSVNGIAPVISSDGKELTYMQEINVTKSPLVAESIETIKVTMGDSTPIFGDNDSLTIGKNEVASSDQLEYGFKYYDTAQDALDSYTGKEVPESKYVSGNGYSPVFLKSQTYFRTITFKVFGSVDSYTFNGTEGTDYVLGEDGVKGRLITFAQPIVVTGPTVTAQIPPLTLTYGSVQYSDVTNTGELSLVDSTTGKSIGTTAGKNEFYASAEDAYENEIGYLDYNDLNADTTYYRRITFNVSKPGDLTNHDYTNDYDFTNEKINGYYAIIGRNTVSYIQEVHVNPVSTTLKVDYQPVKLGTALVRGIPIGYLMNNNENLQNSDIIPKYAFYNSAEDALKESNPILNQKPDPASEADLTIFTKARDYYYPLTFTVSNVNNYKLSGTEGVDYVVDSTNNTITYAVKVTVSKSATTATVPDITIGVGVPISTIDNDFDGISIISNDTGKPIPSSDQIGAYPRIISSELTPRYYDTNEISADNIGTLTPFEGSAFTKPGTYYRLVGLYNSDVPNYSFDDLINGSTGMTQSDGEGNEIVLYIQKVNVVANPVSEKIDTVSASVGSAVTSAPSGDNELTANDESIVDTSKTSTGGEYFASASDAVSNNNSLGTTFKNNGKVYRRITFTLNNPISDYSFEGIAGSDYVVDTNSNTVTFAQPVIVNTSTVVPNISTETVQNGSLISSSENGNNDLMVNNQSIVADNGISYGTDYYDSSDKIADVLSGQVQPVSSVTDGTNFTNAGSYYRIIKFSLKDGLDASGYAFGNGKVDGNTVEYVQKVNVKANSTLVEVPRVITNTGALTTSFDEQADYGLTSAGGSIVSADGIQFGNYYDDVKSALSPATATPSAGVDQVNHKFLKNQTFYRTVTFTLKSDTSNYDFSNLPAGSYSLSGNKITLAQRKSTLKIILLVLIFLMHKAV